MKIQGVKREVAILFCLLLLPWCMFPASAFAEAGDVSSDLLVGGSPALTTAEGANETDATVDNRDIDEEPFIPWNDQMKADTDTLTSQNWMAGISGERYLNEINMPGSHDAGMYNVQELADGAIDKTSDLGQALMGLGYAIGANMAKTQTTYIDEQLKNGARVLDLRLTECKKKWHKDFNYSYYDWEDDGENVWVCHGSDEGIGCYLAWNRDEEFLSFAEVLGWVEDFLEMHPTETVILHIRPEMGDSDKVYKRVRDALDKYAVQKNNDSIHEPFLYREPGSNSPFAKYTHMPQLKDCRGKIVLWFEYEGGVENDDANPPTEVCGGIYQEYIYGENFIDPTNHTMTAADQVDAITNSYGSMNDGNVRLPDSADTNCDFLWHWELNCTGENNGIGGVEYADYVLNILESKNPVDLAHAVNPALVGDGKLFGPQIAGQYIGWVKMDAFDAKYAEAIWRTNLFDGQQYCTVTVESGVDDPRFPTQTYRLLKGTTIVIPDNIYLNDHPQEGATFKGWMGPGSSEPLQKGTAYKVNQDVTFTASWAGVNYDVIYKVVGGTWADGSTEDKTEAVASGSKPASVPTDMDASPGYRGGKWDADPTGTITRPMTFTYTFEAIPEYTVRFDPNVPANASTVCTGSMDDQGFKYLERKALNRNEYTLPGYDFTCWKMKADGTEKLYSDKEEVEKLSEDGGTVTLYAQWSPKKYSITYLSNDDNGSSHSQEAVFDQTDKLHSYSDESFGWSSAGKTLHGWSTSTLGIGSFYEDGEGFCNLCGAPNAYGNLTDVTLFADWVQNGQIVATVTKNGVPQGGLASSLSLTQGSTVFDIPVTDKDHAGTYVFNPAGITVGGNPAQLPEGEYVLQFEAPGYPSASAKITYGGESAASVVFDYYTVSLSKDPVHASFIEKVEISGGASDASAPGVVVALDGDKLGIKTDVSAGYRFERYIAAGVMPIWGEGGSSNAEQTIEVRGQADITALVAPIKYSVTVVGGTADKTTAVVGETVTIRADAPEPGNAFVQWEQIDGVAFENESSVETTFSMPAKNMTATAVCAPIVIDPIKEKVYTGSAIEPADEVRVSLKGVDINLTTDNYEVSFKDNVNAGDAKVTVTMKSPFAESATSIFKIVPADISEAVVTAADQRYNGTEREPMPKVTWKGKVLVKDWDYKIIAYADNVHAGSASVTVKGKGNFKNEATGAFEVKSKPVTIKVNDASKAQGQKDPTFTGTVEGLVASGDLGKIRYVRTNSAEDVGVYEGVLSATYVRNPDYDVTVREGDFTIEPLYTVKFVNWNGTVLQSSGVARGEMPVYAGKTPKKAATAKLVYTFKGWSPAIREVTGEATYEATYTSKARKFAPPAPRMKAVGEDGLSVAWSKVPGADGYDVYFSQCSHDGKRAVVRRVATLEGAGATSWTTAGLKAHKAYKVRIRAYAMEGDEKVYVRSSPLLHLYTAGGTAKFTNAKGVKVNRKKVKLSKGKTFRLKAKVRKLDKSKRLMPKSHAARVRYLSSDTSVATVSPKGKVRARSKGECTVYVYAHSGIYKKVRVTVK